MAPFVYRPLVPQDVSPSDLSSSVLVSVCACGYMAPPPLESAGFAAWMVWGALPFSRPHYPSCALWEWVLLLLYGTDSGGWVTWALVALRPRPGRDVKLFRGGLVRRPCLPMGRDHLANVGLRGPLQF